VIYKRKTSRKQWSVNANLKKERLRLDRAKATEQEIVAEYESEHDTKPTE
jgi:hypothetical protein